MEEYQRSAEAADRDVVDSGRRAALGRMGKAVLAPAVVTLLTTDEAAAWAGSGHVGGRPKHKSYKHKSYKRKSYRRPKLAWRRKH